MLMIINKEGPGLGPSSAYKRVPNCPWIISRPEPHPFLPFSTNTFPSPLPPDTIELKQKRFSVLTEYNWESGKQVTMSALRFSSRLNPFMSNKILSQTNLLITASSFISPPLKQTSKNVCCCSNSILHNNGGTVSSLSNSSPISGICSYFHFIF